MQGRELKKRCWQTIVAFGVGSSLLTSTARTTNAESIVVRAAEDPQAIASPSDAVPSEAPVAEPRLAPTEAIPPATRMETEPSLNRDPSSPQAARSAAPSARKPPAASVFPAPKTLPPTGPWKVLFFENDFTTPHDPVWGDSLKNQAFCFWGHEIRWSTGGELRHRYMDEENRLRPGGPIDTDQQLWRWRHYFDVRTGDVLRFYVEGLHADSFGEEAPPQPIDVNRWDLQNYFADVLLFETDSTTHTLRYGRQELLFGRQRLVSPLDWANVRRNFEGFRYLARGEDVRLDLFAVNPVNAATGFIDSPRFDSEFDHPNRDVWFGGAYLSYTRIENTVIEPYWLWLDVEDSDPVRPDGRRHTLGTRVAHLIPVLDGCGEELRVWDIDLEGAAQVGEDNTEDVRAGFVTAVLGHSWRQLPGKPRLSGLFYYGSGDRDPLDDRNNTFNVLFPLGHAYWGLSDNLSGQNLYDYVLQYDVRPTDKSAITLAHHWFDLASANDVAYNLPGVPVGTPAPANSRDLGTALDVYGYYAFHTNFDVQLGYSWFWYGTYIDRTTPRDDARQFYLQSTLRY